MLLSKEADVTSTIISVLGIHLFATCMNPGRYLPILPIQDYKI